jgi:hypothetical protein
MRIRRSYLFWGLFLVSLGVIPLLVRGGYLDAAAFADLWRFWPLILIALGLALLFGRYRAGIIGVAIAGVVFGTLVGGVFAAGTTWLPNFPGIIDCLPSGDSSTIDQSGTFDGPATIRIDLDCGAADLTVQPGADWSATAEIRGEPPLVEASGSQLSLIGPPTGAHRQEWTITAGSETLDDIVLHANAAGSTFRLTGANLSSFEADVNAADLLIDASDATIDELDVGVNAGRVRITLDGATTGSLQANAGALELCVPPDANLVFDVQEQLTFAHDLGSSGLSQDGDTWTRAGGGPTIELDIEGNAASLDLDPEGGCS